MAGSRARLLVLVSLLALAGCSGSGSKGNTDKDRPMPGLRVAEEALRAGTPQIALQVAQTLLARNPDYVPALLAQGDAQTMLTRLDEANTSYQKALKLEPNSIHGKISLGRIRLATAPAEAISLFEEVLQTEPRNVTVLNDLGIAYDLLGQHDEAQGIYRRIDAISPNMTAARVNLALSLAMSGRANEGVRMMEPLANAADANDKMRHNYAAVLALAGREDDAESILSRDLSPTEIREALATYRLQRQGAFKASTAAAEPAPPVAVKPVSVPAPVPPAAAVAEPMPEEQTTQAAPVATPIKAEGHQQTVELGVFQSEDAAVNKWNGLLKKLPDAMDGRQKRIVTGEADGKKVWRLWTGGFADVAAVRAFCATLHTVRATCHLAGG